MEFFRQVEKPREVGKMAWMYHKFQQGRQMKCNSGKSLLKESQQWEEEAHGLNHGIYGGYRKRERD